MPAKLQFLTTLDNRMSLPAPRVRSEATFNRVASIFFLHFFSPHARQIAGPSTATVKDPAGNGDAQQGHGSGAQPGVSRVAQRPAEQAEAPEKASVPGSNPAVLPAKGPTNSPD